MKTTKEFLKEQDLKEHVVFSFGRFQPPTIGHQLLVQKVISETKRKSADGVIFLSSTTDNKNNPLSPERKLFWFKKIFKQNFVDVRLGKTFLECMKEFDGHYKKVTMVCGSDRIDEFKKILNKYNKDLYSFQTIDVVSCGVRDGDTDVSNSSGTLVRNAAKNGDVSVVRDNIPNLTDDDIKNLIGELVNNKDTKRESYISGNYLTINEVVSVDGDSHKIVKMGTNYLTLVNESSEIVVKWVNEVKKSKSIGKCFQTKIMKDKNIKYNGFETKHIKHFVGLKESLLTVIEKHDETTPLDVLNLIKMTDKLCETLVKIPNTLSESELKTLKLYEKYASIVGLEYFSDVINEIKTTHDLAKSKLTGTEFIKKLNDIEQDADDEQKSDNDNDGDTGIGDTLIDADDSVTKQHIKLKYVDEEISDDEFSDFDIDKFVDEIPEDDILDLFDTDEFVFVDNDGNIVGELDDGSEEEKIDEVMTRQGRIQAKARFRRSQSKRLRNAKIALKRRSSSDKLQKKARRLAVQVLKRKLAKKDINKLSISEKERLERMVARRGKVITRMVGKLVNKIKKIENNRLAKK